MTPHSRLSAVAKDEGEEKSMNEHESNAMQHHQTAITTVTVDIVVLRPVGIGFETLLIQRRKDPFVGMWAIPGGKLDSDDPSLEAAALRELREETAIEGVLLQQIGAFGDLGRDPRGRFVSIAYVGFVTAGQFACAGDDAASVAWYPMDQLPTLAFDHAAILKQAFAFVQR